MSVASATFAVWTSAWLHGHAASDDVLDALAAWGRPHRVVADGVADIALPQPGEEPAAIAELLSCLRAQHAEAARLVLPVSGDTRGLGGAGPVVTTALRAGEAAVLTGADIAVVPAAVDGGVDWTVHPVADGGEPPNVGIADADNALAEAIRISADTMSALDVAADASGVRERIAARMRAQPRLSWPDGTPGRALRVLQKADEIAAILAVAETDEPGGALSASAARQRAHALRPLANAVRDARSAAVTVAALTFAGRASAA